MDKLKNVLEKLKGMSGNKKLQYLAIVIIIAVILTIYFSTLTGPEEDSGQAAEGTSSTSDSAEALEQKLKAVLEKVDGAGQVEVIINYESSPELIPAVSEDVDTSATQDEGRTTETESRRTSIAGSSRTDDALIVKEMQPEVRGVIVVAEGADDISLKIRLQDAVTTLLDIAPSQVEILKMAD